MKNKDKYNTSKELEFDMVGNAFIGDLFSINEDLDNTSQNLMMYLESKKIYEASKHNDDK
ncbi:MAG: hypothetical protein IJH34_06545 [Romboutsia sp.]|nr:hypothetical protein [Romboutsia sp.]